MTKVCIMMFLHCLALFSIQVKPEVLPLIAMKMLRTTVQQAFCKYSEFAFVSYGVFSMYHVPT